MEKATSTLKRTWMIVLAVSLVASMILAACGGEDDEAADVATEAADAAEDVATEAATVASDVATEVAGTDTEATTEATETDTDTTPADTGTASPAAGTTGSAAAVDSSEVCGDYPDQAVEFVVPFAPGGGSDNLARTITSILQSEGITDGTINVVNREGGSGTVGQNYVVGKEGDNYVIMTGTPSLITNPLVLGSETGYQDFTPLARLALDQLLIVVRDDSEYETIEDLVEAAEANPDQVSWGGTGIGGEDSLVLAQLEKASGANFNYVSFESGGEVQAALLGGHVDVASANPNEIIGQLEAGELRALAIAGEERAAELPDVPTLIEKGWDAKFEQFRGVLGPPNMDPEVVGCWGAIFQELTQTERWQTEYIEANMLRSAYLPPTEFATWLNEESERLAALIEEMDLGQ